MGMRWRGFEMPTNLTCDEETLTDKYGKFIAEPFERGYGTTIGNSLRRILLSSIEGAAVTRVKIAGVDHEFSTLPGVVEDSTQIILNVKKLVLGLHSKKPKTVQIKKKNKGEVKAKDIIADETVEIIDKDLHIATLGKGGKLEMEMVVGKGRGYVSAEENKVPDQPIGSIAIDSIFTPVTRVSFQVEETRVGQITDYDKLIMEIWTNGSITPKDALTTASYILQKHFDIFVNYGQVKEEEDEEKGEVEETLKEKLEKPVSELELSVRAEHCLKEANIKTVGDLIQKTRDEMLKFRNFGETSFDKLAKMLKKMDLSFGMNLKEEEAADAPQKK
jgi:DNA-directed RNA polymerase subunit alpha